MAENESLEDNHLSGRSFSQLLFSDDVVGPDMSESFNYSSSFSEAKPPTMLCFGNYYNEGEEVIVCPEKATRTGQKSGVTCSDSSSASSSNNTNTNPNPTNKFNKKRNGSGQKTVQRSNTGNGATETCKKAKTENPAPAGHARVRKEKLGERIIALQQLVSPYGKSDTASVLHEAMGYIRFLHEQVQVLCCPYLERLPTSLHHHQQPGNQGNGDNGSTKDLRSRGLCLVPVGYTVHVANNNGADLWSPRAM